MRVSLLLFLGIIGCYPRTTTDCVISTVTVIQLGGCSSTGMCGVILSNGEVTHLTLPVVGQKIDRKACHFKSLIDP